MKMHQTVVTGLAFMPIFLLGQSLIMHQWIEAIKTAMYGHIALTMYAEKPLI